MRIGLSTPVVVQFPGVCSDWEQGGGIDDLVSIAVTADELVAGSARSAKRAPPW